MSENKRESEIKYLDKKVQIILEKYKDKPRLYPKMKEIYQRFMDYKPVDSRNYIELAKLTAKIDFGCNFKDDGTCRANRSNACCCSQCRGYIGHFSIRFFSGYDYEDHIEKELLYYTKKFSNETGFWRKNKGCILPRERRSPTCLCYNCSDKLTNEERLLVDIIRDYKRVRPNYTHRIIKILKDYFLYRE